VFCEKPFGGTLAQALSMADSARRAPSCVVAVNFQFRYELGIALLKKQLDDGAIGKPNSIDISWLTAGRANPQSPWTWRNDKSTGGGVVGAFFSHVADMFCWLATAEPSMVFGQTSVLIAERNDAAGQARPVTAEDTVAAQIELDNGVLATCRITNCQTGGDGMRIEARGDRGMLVYRHSPPFTPEDQTLELRTVDGIHSIPLIETHTDELACADSRARAVHRCVADFVARIDGAASANLPSLLDGVRVQRIIDALQASVMTGQSVILKVQD
jgi:predicted dehydrogenase